MTRGHVAAWLSVAVVPFGWCVALGSLAGGDPLLAIEIAGAAVGATWASLMVLELVRGRRLGRALATDAEVRLVHGITVRVTSHLGSDAVVVGALRPAIFVGASMLERLDDNEIRSVVFHEDHHRRTLAPLRSAALTAWLRLFGWSGRARRALVERLTGLETAADAAAIRRGASPASLARVLLLVDPATRPASFAYGAQQRVHHLLGLANGDMAAARGHVPYEWAPVTIFIVAMVGCHAGL
jgi:hypothetical protein